MESHTPFINNDDNGRNSDADSETEFPSPINGESLDSTDPEELAFEDVDSTCSTPYVSAPSSPDRGPVHGFFYSAPASPMHLAISKNPLASAQNPSSASMENHSFAFEFDFSARFGSNEPSSTAIMSSADELFLNGKIRPMRVSTRTLLEPPLEAEDEERAEIVEFVRGRDLRLREKLQRRRTRSMSPLRNELIEWSESQNGDVINGECFGAEKEGQKIEERASNSESSTPSISASSSRSSSAGRSSKRWIFLKDFLHRSKSEGRRNNNFWSNISFAHKKSASQGVTEDEFMNPLGSEAKKVKGSGVGKAANGVGKRRVPPSPHELHYTANRAHSEEMKKKTYLPYRQGLLGCLGFSSKGYGAVNGFAKALNSASSR